MDPATDVGGSPQETDLAKEVDGSPLKKSWLDLARYHLHLAWSAAHLQLHYMIVWTQLIIRCGDIETYDEYLISIELLTSMKGCCRLSGTEDQLGSATRL